MMIDDDARLIHFVVEPLPNSWSLIINNINVAFLAAPGIEGN